MSDPNYVSNERLIVIRQYGLLAPIDWESDCDDEMRGANQFWNHLVEIENAFRTAFRNIINNSAEIISIRSQIDSLISIRTILEEKENNATDRGILISIRSEIREISKKIKSLSNEVKSQRLALRREKKKEINDNEMVRREAVRLARRDNGLWWQTADVIYLRYLNTRQRVLKDGVELRFRSPDLDNIQIVNQNRRGLSLDDLIEGKGEFSFTPLPPNAFTHKSKGERRRLQRTQLTLCVYSRRRQPRLVTWPMQMHRPIPDDCTIKYVTVTRKKSGPRTEWKATFTCYRNSEPLRISAPSSTVAISFSPHHFDHAIRVGLLRNHAGASEWITLPKRELDRFDYAGRLIATQKGYRSEIMAALVDLNWGDAPEDLLALWRQIESAPASSRRLINLLKAWPDRGWQNDMRTRFEEWSRRDLRNWREITGLRLHLQRARLDHYRKAAHEIALKYDTIILGDVPRRQRPNRNATDSEDAETQATLWQLQQIAAPGILRQSIILTARAHHRIIATSEERPTP